MLSGPERLPLERLRRPGLLTLKKLTLGGHEKGLQSTKWPLTKDLLFTISRQTRTRGLNMKLAGSKLKTKGSEFSSIQRFIQAWDLWPPDVVGAASSQRDWACFWRKGASTVVEQGVRGTTSASEAPGPSMPEPARERGTGKSCSDSVCSAFQPPLCATV